MYVLKNAIKNIMNSPIRNIIIGVIIAVISLICCMSLALLRVSDKAEKEALLKASVTARIIKGDPSGSIDTSYAVSYTHLDVYKRQTGYWPPGLGQARWRC